MLTEETIIEEARHLLLIALLVQVPLAALLLLTGCEVSGEYHDDGLTVQFGDTNCLAESNGNLTLQIEDTNSAVQVDKQ